MKQNIFWTSGESVAHMNQEREIALRYLREEVRTLTKRIQDWETWIEWEKVVSEVLNNMANRNPKYTIIHDVQFQWQNIDHIVIYDDRILIIIETKAYNQTSFKSHKNGIIYQVSDQWKYLRQHLKIEKLYVKSFVCFSRLKNIHEEAYGVNLIGIDSLEDTITWYISDQVEYHHPPRNLKDKILDIKYPPINLPTSPASCGIQTHRVAWRIRSTEP